jgi:hypothetical protein
MKLGVIGVAVVGAILCALFGNGVALAEPTVPVTACLDGSEPPSALVNSYKADGATINLRCGSVISYGVMHIDSEHAIAPADAPYFMTCVSNVFERGEHAPGLAGRTGYIAFDWEIVGGGSAIGVVDSSFGNNIVTVYTKEAVSNDWRRCAAQVPTPVGSWP